MLWQILFNDTPASVQSYLFPVFFGIAKNLSFLEKLPVSMKYIQWACCIPCQIYFTIKTFCQKKTILQYKQQVNDRIIVLFFVQKFSQKIVCVCACVCLCAEPVLSFLNISFIIHCTFQKILLLFALCQSNLFWMVS